MLNPWQQLPLDPPFVLPDDEPILRTWSARARDGHEPHLELLPEPFLGRPDAAVVLLNLNPGYDEQDIVHHRDPLFAQLSRANLLHQPLAFPFYLLDTRLKAPGCKWWETKLRCLIERCGQQVVARNVLCVEYFGYHSLHFGYTRADLPSQAYGASLVRSAVARGAVVVLMRGERFWCPQVPELRGYSRFFRVENPQTPAISPRNCPTGYDQVVRAIEEQEPACRPS